MDTYITGNTIRKYREKQGMTQLQLAEKLRVSDKAVSRWETGKGYPDISLLNDLAEVLNISLVELLSGTEVVNRNIASNMLRSRLYVCPVCGNVIHSTGDVSVICCGITLPPLTAEEPDESHGIICKQVEDETYVQIDHEMTKQHYISFAAYVTESTFQLVKLYPEGAPEARFKFKGKGKLYCYCNRHGLKMYQTEVKERWGSTKEYKEYEEKTEGRTPDELNETEKEFMELFRDMGSLRGLEVTDPRVRNKVSEIRRYITEHYYRCSMKVFASLGEMYRSDERFRQSIDNAGGCGTAEFTADAIRSYTEGLV